MGAPHQHSHAHPPVGDDARMKRVLIASLTLTLAFVVFEALAGFSAHSLALLSDAGHNFTDAFALLLAAFGVYLQARPGDHERTYGYQRAGVLAAFVNALSLVVLAGIPLGEAFDGAEDGLLISVTERRTRDEIDAYVTALAKAVA